MTDRIAMNLPRIHPREQPCQRARLEIEQAIADAVKKHNLTTAEQLRIVNAVCSDWIGGVAKWAIRYDRHDRGDKPGGTA